MLSLGLLWTVRTTLYQSREVSYAIDRVVRENALKHGSEVKPFVFRVFNSAVVEVKLVYVKICFQSNLKT